MKALIISLLMLLLFFVQIGTESGVQSDSLQDAKGGSREVAKYSNAGLQSWADLSPQSAQAQFNIAEAYLARPYSADKAVEPLKRAIEMKPDQSAAYEILGWAYLDRGSYYGLQLYRNDIVKYTHAVEAFRQGLWIEPGSAEGYIGLGFGCLSLRRYEEAHQAFLQALQINPECWEAYSGLKAVYRGLDRWNEAIDALQRSMQLKDRLGIGCVRPNHFHMRAEDHFLDLLELGDLYAKLARHEEALDAYRSAVAVNPRNAGAHFSLGLTYMALGDKEAALREYEAIMALGQVESCDGTGTSSVATHYSEALLRLVREPD